MYWLFIRYDINGRWRFQSLNAPGPYWSAVYKDAQKYFGKRNVKIRWSFPNRSNHA